MIARVFGELGLVEEWGSGYKRIKEACQKGGYPEPLWEELGTVLRVTFFPHPEITKEVRVGTKLGPSRDQVGTKLQLDEELIALLRLCKEPNSIITLMQSLDWKNRTKFRKKYIEPLLAQGYLEMTFPDKPNSMKQKYQTTALGQAVLSDQ